MYTKQYRLSDYQPGDVCYSAFFLFFKLLFFHAVADWINRVKNAIQNVVEWKYTPAENGNPQANYKCTGSIQNSLNLGAIQLSSYPAHVSMVLCVASAVEDASSLHSAQHLVSIWRARVGNAHRSWKKKLFLGSSWVFIFGPNAQNGSNSYE